MGLFNKFKKADTKISNEELLKKHQNGEISDTEFIKEFGKANVFYTTPFGDHKDGSKKLFILPCRENVGYNPVFSSKERMREFYEKSGRAAYMIIENTFASFLEVTQKTNEGNTPIKMGVIIDPGVYGITLEIEFLQTAIKLAKS